MIMAGKTGIVKRTIKNDSSTRGDISGMITDTLSSYIDMPSGSNTIYDVNDLADGMMRASIMDATVGGAANGARNSQISDAIMNHPIPSDQWFNNIITKTNSEAAIDGFARMVSRLLVNLNKLGQIPREGLTIAIDMHLIPRYDRIKGPELTRSKSKAGTGLFERYITAQCVDDNARLILGCLPVYASESIPDMVRCILEMVHKTGCKIKLVLLDREFFSTGVIQEIIDMHVDYLMPCTNTTGVVGALNEFAAGRRQAVSEHILIGSGRQVPYHMVITDRKKRGKKPAILPKEKFIGFATSLPHIDINQYSSRWGIETGYSMIEAMRAKTRSRDAGARLFCFLYSLMVFNGWVMLNSLNQYRLRMRLKGKNITQLTLKFMLLRASGCDIQQHSPSRFTPLV